MRFVFFLEDNGYISCALLKNKWIGYQILRTSGKLNLYNPGYLCSFFMMIMRVYGLIGVL